MYVCGIILVKFLRLFSNKIFIILVYYDMIEYTPSIWQMFLSWTLVQTLYSSKLWKYTVKSIVNFYFNNFDISTIFF